MRTHGAVALVAVALVAMAAFLLGAPLAGGLSLWGFTLDDAYISFRYSENLASGHGPVWNVGLDPVEGYTSFLWVVLMSAAEVILGLPADAASKLISVAAALGLVAILALYGHRRVLAVRVVAIAGLALSPAFLLITAQGMETTLAALLATASAVLFFEAVQRQGHRALGAYFGCGLLSVLTRPDLAVFWGVTLLGLVVLSFGSQERRALPRIGLWLAVAFVLPALVYLAWRRSYYGYLLPNSFYVKSSPGLISPFGLSIVKAFLKDMALVYVAALVPLFALTARRASDRGRVGHDRLAHTRLFAIAVLFAAVTSFVAAGILFDPIQGGLYRFQMPVYPVLLLLLVLTAAELGPLRWSPRRAWTGLATGALVVAALVILPLHTLSEARSYAVVDTQHDRREAGQALAAVGGERPSMLVTEAGALPFFAGPGWRATDLLGLNDERIAREGPSVAYLRELAPDMVMASVFVGEAEKYRVDGPYLPLAQLLRTDGYELAAAIEKTDSRLRPSPLLSQNLAHFYWVRSSSPRAGAITAALNGMDGVRRLDRPRTLAVLRAFGFAPSGRRRVRVAELRPPLAQR